MRLANEGRHAAATRMLLAAQELTDDVNVRARIAGTLAYIKSRTGAPAEGEQMCLDAMAQPGIDSHTYALLAGQLGALAEQAGRYDDSERWLTQGIDALEEDSEEMANLLVNRSLVNMRRLRLAEASRDAARASEIFGALARPVDQAQALHNEGYMALLGGDLITAMRIMSSARSTLVDVSPVFAAVCDVDRAEVLRDAGHTIEAERILAQAATVFGRQRMPQSRGEAEYHLARSLLAHDPLRARPVATRAARRFRTVGNDSWASRAEAVRMRAELSGGQVMRTGHHVPPPRRVPARDDVEGASGALERFGFGSDAAALRMTHELWRARQPHVDGDPARITRVPAAASMEVRLLAYEVRAARASARGRHGDARRHAAAGLVELSAWLSDFGSLDLQTSAVMQGNGLIRVGLDSAVQSGRPEVVFEWSEWARHMSMQVIPLRPPPDAQLADDLAEIRMLRSEGGDWQADPRARELRERVRERQWSTTGSAAIQPRATLDEVQAVLDDETALLSYVFSGDSLIVLVVTGERVSMLPIDGWRSVRDALPALRSDLDMAATIRGRMGEVVRRTLDDRLASFSRELLDRAVEVAGARRYAITVPGLLGGIPWAMLPALRGKAFTLPASASRWVRQRGGAEPPHSVGFAAGPDVARADEEVDAAAAAWPDPVIVEAATVDDVTSLAAEVDVLHIAAHGRHSSDNPMFSGLELADGALFGYDIDRMPRVPSTVVLSACEAGRSSVRWGEEAVGMARAWLHAGTSCVIAAPVVVADDVACELLGAMHEGLAAGRAPSEALAAASESTGIVAPFQAHGAGF
ncbi:CHAT domain-containing protein [Microbacterium sp. cf046]|nr:CHAT domain-containing protein [Microbacterium sp. cf046]